MGQPCTTITHQGEMGVGDSGSHGCNVVGCFVCGFVWHSGTLMSRWCEKKLTKNLLIFAYIWPLAKITTVRQKGLLAGGAHCSCTLYIQERVSHLNCIMRFVVLSADNLEAFFSCNSY